MDVLITGSTGMVGKSVLQECINDKRVKNVYLINRIPVNLKSPKISEFIIFFSLFIGTGYLSFLVCMSRLMTFLFFNIFKLLTVVSTSGNSGI